MYIDGAWTDAADGRTLEVINPADEETIGTVPIATARDLDTALDAADRGWKKWRLDETIRLVDDALSKGATLVCGGRRPEGFTRGFYYEPTVLTGVTPSMRIMKEEPFCPVAPIVGFTDLDDAIEKANSTEYGLAGYVFTRNTRTAFLASERLDVGMVGVNHLLLAAAETPFGGVKPKEILTRSAFENAMKVLMAIGGSTNAVIHLTAIARRCRIALTLEDFNAASELAPLLVDCKPSGSRFMEDFHKAGGMPALLKSLAPLLDTSAVHISGRPLKKMMDETNGPASWQSVIRTLDDPLGGTGSLTALKGTLAPDGAIVKRSAATASLLQHRGPATVFESPEDVAALVDDPSLSVTPDHVLVMKKAGPIAAGMPEAGSMPIPRYLAEKGVKDMLRISDARMSGTASGAVVLHCSPEAAAGGPLALVENGDLIEIDIEKKRLDLLVPEEELARRRASFRPPPLPDRGWRRLYAEHVLQAHLGADLDFLAPL